MWINLIFFATAFIFVAMALAALWHARWVRRLPSLAALQATGHPANDQAAEPRCSVIIAARDEENRIEQTLRHLFAQRGLTAEFIVIDDRSSDGTPKILERLAHEDTRLRVHRIDQLPDGWLGKCHACHVGASIATGDWILFTDADCWLKPDVIARAIRVAERDNVEHITLSPGTVIESSAARAWHLLFLISMVNWFSGVNRNHLKSYLGIGAFNLVRTSAYRASGGYQALRLTVVDDIKLGLLLNRAGKRSRAFLGVDDVECHWGSTVRSMIKIMEKNYFAVTDYRVWLVAVGVAAALMVFGLLIAGVASGTMAGLSAGLSPLFLIVPGIVLARRIQWAWTSALLVPLMIPVFVYTLIKSTLVTLRQGGVRWRDTFYPLAMLRGGNFK